MILTAPVASVALVALGAALWGTDGAFRQPLVAAPARWSPYTIVLYEHVILTVVVAPVPDPALAQPAPARPRRLAGRVRRRLGRLGAGHARLHDRLRVRQPRRRRAAAEDPAAVGDRRRRRRDARAAAARSSAGSSSRRSSAPTCSRSATMAPADAFTGAQGRAALLALVAAALWGAATAFGRRTLVAIEPQLVTAVRFTLALPLLAVIALYEGAVAPPAAAHASDWPRLVGLALIPGLARPAALLPRPRAHPGIGGDVRRAGLPGDGARRQLLRARRVGQRDAAARLRHPLGDDRPAPPAAGRAPG